MDEHTRGKWLNHRTPQEKSVSKLETSLLNILVENPWHKQDIKESDGNMFETYNAFAHFGTVTYLTTWEIF